MLTSLVHSPMNAFEWIGVILLVGLAGGLIVGAIAIITEHYRKSARDEMDTVLKLEMLERGMSADDIIRVLEATGGPPEDHAEGAEQQVAQRRRRHHSWHARHAMHEAMRTASQGSQKN